MSYNLTRLINKKGKKDEITFINNNKQRIKPANNNIKIYSKEDSKIYKLDSLGRETSFGNVVGPSDSTVDSVCFFDGTSGTSIKQNTDVKYQTGFLSVPDIKTSLTTSLNDELKKIDNFATSTIDITNINGLVRVPEIALEKVYSTLQSSHIGLDETAVNVNTFEFLYNGVRVATLDDISTTITTLASVGLGSSIVYQQNGPNIKVKGIVQGTGITIIDHEADLEIINADRSRLVDLEMKTQNILTASATYVVGGSIINSSVPFINASGALSSNISNLYVQIGVNTIQSAINAIVSAQAYSIQLSTGTFLENIVLTKENYILAGSSCPLFAPTTKVQSITIGASTSALTSLIKVKDIVFSGSLTFYSDTVKQGLKTYFSNCEFQGVITFPQLAVSGTYIYFFDCSFSGASMISFLNQTSYQISFTRCDFGGRSFANANSVANNLTFKDCVGLISLSMGTSTFYGMNTSYGGCHLYHYLVERLQV